MKETRLIVTDLDGTLLTDKKEISGYTASILNALRQKGVKIAFATARPYRGTIKLCTLFKPDFIIANNGARIYTYNTEYEEYTLIKQINIDGGVVTELIDIFNENESVENITIDSEDCLYTNILDVSGYEEGWNPIYCDFKLHKEFLTTKISIDCCDDNVIRSIRETYPNLNMYGNIGESWYQLTASGATKFEGVKRVTEIMRIELKSVIAFGNDYNDAEMLAGCGVGVAVENSSNEARKAADYICADNNNDGVAKWLEANIIN